MKLFAGLSRTDYEDLLGAVGALVDERGWSDISLMEVDEGLIVQVLVKPSLQRDRPHLETYLLTDTDLERVQQDALRRRKKKAPPPMIAVPQSEPLPPPPLATTARPTASRPVEDRLAALVAQGRDGHGAGASAYIPGVEEDTLPPLPPLDGLPTERPLSVSEAFDEASFFPQTLPLQLDDEDDAPIFAPEPMRFTPVPSTPAYDPGAARAAVVMAHIVAARLKSGVPLTGDDPDLASLLEQVRALDEIGIGKG